MESAQKGILVGVIGVVGAVLYLGLTVYPFQYGPVESVLLAGAFVLLALLETVLDGATFAAGREREK